MNRSDSVQVALGSGSPPASFSGTVGYLFTVPSGSDCSDQLTTAGGEYDALPCTILYSAAASHQ